MRYLKTFRVTIIATSLLLVPATSTAFWFTGGPVWDGLSLSEAISKNITNIETRVQELANFDALKKLVKEQAKAAFKSGGEKGVAGVQAEQEMLETKKNHKVSLEMAPRQIPGCGIVMPNAGSTPDDNPAGAAADAANAAFASIRDFLFDCGDQDESEEIKDEREEEDKSTMSTYDDSINDGRILGQSSPGQEQLDKRVSDKVYKSLTRIKDKITEAKRQIKNKLPSDATNYDVHDYFVSLVKGEITDDDIDTSFLKGNEDDPEEVEVLAKAIALMNNDSPQISQAEYNEVMDYLRYMLNTSRQVKKKSTRDPKEVLLDAQKNITQNLPYMMVKGQFDDKLAPAEGLPSKAMEIYQVGEYYVDPDYITKVSESRTLPTQVMREKAVAKAFQAWIAVEQYKKAIDREKTLAVRLIQKL